MSTQDISKAIWYGQVCQGCLWFARSGGHTHEHEGCCRKPEKWMYIGKELHACPDFIPVGGAATPSQGTDPGTDAELDTMLEDGMKEEGLDIHGRPLGEHEPNTET